MIRQVNVQNKITPDQQMNAGVTTTITGRYATCCCTHAKAYRANASLEHACLLPFRRVVSKRHEKGLIATP